MQLNKLKLGIKKGTEVTLNFSTNKIGDSNGEVNFLRKLLLADTQVSRLCKAFTNNLSANIRLSKTQLPNMVQLGGILGPLSGLSVLLNPKEGTKKLVKKWRKIKTL